MDLRGADIRNIYHLCLNFSGAGHDEKKLNVNIPYYQRPYGWKLKHISSLFRDFFDESRPENQNGYFMGSIVTVVEGDDGSCHDIIDGQQRITTVYLINYFRFLLLRSYVEELLVNKNAGLLLGKFKELMDSYCKILGSKYTDLFQSKYVEMSDFIDEIAQMSQADLEEKYENMLQDYREYMCLPVKDYSNMDIYLNQYYMGLKKFFRNENFSLHYSRKSLNEKLEIALESVCIQLSNDYQPSIYTNKADIEDGIVLQYIDAIENIFICVKEITFLPEKVPMINARNMIEKINGLLDNLNFCVIITGNVKDAYTLFEVLNDRAMEISDLDLIKNMFYKEYCNRSKDSDCVIDKNIESLDDLWGENIFSKDIGLSKTKLIAYLSTVYLTADNTVNPNNKERYRDCLQTKYIDQRIDTYSYINIKNDFLVFRMVRVILDEYKVKFLRALSWSMKAEDDKSKSITYRLIHLLRALDLDGVMPAIINVILKSFIIDYASNGSEEINISLFVDYLKRLEEVDECKSEEFSEINKCANMLWRIVLLAKDYETPRSITRRIVEGNNARGYNAQCFSLTVDDMANLSNQYFEWTANWKYSDQKRAKKLKILFIRLYKSDFSDGKLIYKPSQHTFEKTDCLQLDHLEASNYDINNADKHFIINSKEDERENYVEMLGNFMILDNANNDIKDNMPLYNALSYYENMGNHWLINEIKELMADDQYSVQIDATSLRVPKKEFFIERKKRLQNYFFAILQMNVDDTEINLSV